MKDKTAADAAWEMFKNTGDPSYYSLYRKFTDDEQLN